jgi:phage gpG-like protein
MAFSVRLRLDAAPALQAVADVEQRLTHLTPVLEDIRERLLRSVQQNFAAGGRPMPWKPSRRALSEPGGKTLIKTGILKNSITGQVERNAVRIGTNISYAPKHQFGLGVVARPFLLVQVEDEQYIRRVLEEYIAP